MQNTDPESLAEDVEDGTYYTAARRWYSELFHTPIAERSYYVIIITLALINGYFAIHSFVSVFPIKELTPFITYSDDVWEDWPHINRIAQDKSEDKNIAVMKFMIKSYVANRESYNLKLYELRYRNIWSQSAPAVFESYKAMMDASNPYSPYRLYTNKAERVVNVLSLSYDRGANVSHAHVLFEALVKSLAGSEEISSTKWRADLAFKYTDFTVDQSVVEQNPVVRIMANLGVFGLTKNVPGASGEKHKVVPMTFVVSSYQVKELIE